MRVYQTQRQLCEIHKYRYTVHFFFFWLSLYLIKLDLIIIICSSLSQITVLGDSTKCIWSAKQIFSWTDIDGCHLYEYCLNCEFT